MCRSTAGDHLAGRQELLEALRSTIDIEMLQQFEQRLGLQGFGLVRLAVILADQQRQFLAIARHLAAYVDRFDGILALRRLGLRRGAVSAQHMQQAGPAYGQWLRMAGALVQHFEQCAAGIGRWRGEQGVQLG